MTGLPRGQLLEAIDAAIHLLQCRSRIEDVCEAVLEQIAQAVHCQWGAYWALDPSAQYLQAIAVWSALVGTQGKHFEQDTRVRKLAAYAGNAGRVWRTRKPIWTTDLIMEMCLPRSLKASQAGLRAGVWFSVQTDTAVYGVIELLARDLPKRSYETLVTFERAGSRLGFALEELHDASPYIH